MTYPFVHSAVDLGRARGPRLAFVVHMAEGGGTVGYLSRPNPNGVSVHFVIERTGPTVQMLELSHMHSSIRASAIRITDDSDRFYGVTAAKAVMGDWARPGRTLGPNHASIAVEIEGFARDGPNTAQAASLKVLYADLRKLYPGIRSLGHRDFASYKACPGKLIPWDQIGSHGKATFAPEDDVRVVTVTINEWPAARPFIATVPVLRRFSATEELTSITDPSPYSATVDANVSIEGNPSSPTGVGFLRLAAGGSAGKYVLAREVTLA